MSLNPRIHDWQGRRVWLMGASSGIGLALAEALLAAGAALALSARRTEPLLALAERYPDRVVCLPCDATSVESLRRTAEVLQVRWGRVDLALYLAGDYEPLQAPGFDPARIKQLCDINYLGGVHFSHAALPLIAASSTGGIALVSSVAGYRGLPKALGYGPAKAALIHFAEVLYIDLHRLGLGVWLINPGFVQTRLTAVNDFRMPALISPEEAARAILKGFASGDFEIHFPKRFTGWLKLLRCLPYCLYLPLVARLIKE